MVHTKLEINVKTLAAYLAACLCIVAASNVDAKTIDLSTMTEIGGPYEISFCERPSPSSSGFPGHAFVALSEGAGNNRKFVSLGLTVQSGVGTVDAALSYFGVNVGGIVKEEQYSHIRQECLNVKVNSDAYRRAYDETQSALNLAGTIPGGLARFESYRLGSNDCITFVNTVATVLIPTGLRVPERQASDLPIDFIEKIRNLN